MEATSIAEFNLISHFLVDHVKRWATIKPDAIAIIDAETGKHYTWQHFEAMIDLLAIKLLDDGWQKGDIVVSMLPFLPEHVFLEYACFKLGILFCPLDMRLKVDETIKSVELLKSARRIMFIHPDDTDSEDKYGRTISYEFKKFARRIRKDLKFVKDFVQMSPQEDCDPGTTSWLVFEKAAKESWLTYARDEVAFRHKMADLDAAASSVREDDPILVIYTTGTTGFPKPALLTNAGITCQNFCLMKGFDIQASERMLVNLPPSHVGGQTEQLMTAIMAGGVAVLLHVFKAKKSLQAIQQYRVTALGQIPALYIMEWKLPEFKSYDLKCLRFALYGGQGVPIEFLRKLSKMAPNFGSGLGLTELSGFCTYTPFGTGVTPEDIQASLGHAFDITPLSIRDPMKPDGFAGDEKARGEIGEICFSGPQVFKGYFGNDQATRKTVSMDGFCYTGDLGFMDEKSFLHLAGRSKFVIKPKGYQCYPVEIEEHIQKLPEVELAAVVGAPHEEFSEGVVAFIEVKKGKHVTMDKLQEHCKQLAAYKRPSLYVFIDEIPLNRVEKTDYAELKKIVGTHVAEARAKGGWDVARPGSGGT